jgi:hypothetical protein
MTSREEAARIAGVSTRSFAHLQLEVDLDADPIAGSVKHAGQTDRPFSGWMELTRTIELSVDQVRARRIPPIIHPPSRSQP